jgi:hypothetical protein
MSYKRQAVHCARSCGRRHRCPSSRGRCRLGGASWFSCPADTRSPAVILGATGSRTPHPRSGLSVGRWQTARHSGRKSSKNAQSMSILRRRSALEKRARCGAGWPRTGLPLGPCGAARGHVPPRRGRRLRAPTQRTDESPVPAGRRSPCGCVRGRSPPEGSSRSPHLYRRRGPAAEQCRP